MHEAFVSAPFDDLRSHDIRLLEEASGNDPVQALIWSDAAVLAATGKPPKFPLEERKYCVEAIRYVSHITVQAAPRFDRASLGLKPGERPICFDRERNDSARLRGVCDASGVELRIIPEATLGRFAGQPRCPLNPKSPRKKVVVTGCFDWFHSGHVRFFEEANDLGDLYVIVGHDANIRLLKGEGHPMFPASERCYIANSVRFAKMALVSSGNGWLDAEPEIDKIKPDIYAVNEDGNRPEKRKFCRDRGIEYKVLKRLPRPGLTRRQSSNLRGF